MRDINTGITYINAPTIGAEVHLPFGGIKQTGNGHREGGPTVLDLYTEWKTIYVDFSGRLQKAQIGITLLNPLRFSAVRISHPMNWRLLHNWRLMNAIPDCPARNMAIDEALYRPQLHIEQPTLRLYTWMSTNLVTWLFSRLQKGCMRALYRA